MTLDEAQMMLETLRDRMFSDVDIDDPDGIDISEQIDVVEGYIDDAIIEHGEYADAEEQIVMDLLDIEASLDEISVW